MIQIFFLFIIQIFASEYDGYQTLETKLEYVNRMINNVKEMIDSKSFEKSKEILSTLIIIDEEITNIERDYKSVQNEIQKQSKDVSRLKQQLENLYQNFNDCSLPKLKKNQKTHYLRDIDFNANLSVILGFIFALIIFIVGLLALCLLRSCFSSDEEEKEEVNNTNNEESNENKPKSE